MSYFDSLIQKLHLWNNVPNSPFNLSGLTSNQFALLFTVNERILNDRALIFTENNSEAQNLYDILKNRESHNVYFLPGQELNHYEDYIFSEKILYEQFSTLFNSLHSNKKNIIISPIENILNWWPNPSFFIENKIDINVSDIVSPQELSEKLVSLGYDYSITVEEPGTFSKKGEIFDIYPLNRSPIRLNYFDDMIESIHSINRKTNQTNKNKSFDTVTISPTPKIITNHEFSKNFRTNIKQPNLIHKNAVLKRKEILSKLNDKIIFENYPLYLHYFFKNKISLVDFFHDNYTNIFIQKENSDQNLEQIKEEAESTFNWREGQSDNDLLIQAPSEHFNFNINYGQNSINVNLVQLENSIEKNVHDVQLSFQGLGELIFSKIEKSNTSHGKLLNTLKYLKQIKDKTIIFCYNREIFKKEVIDLCNEFELHINIQFLSFNLEKGLYYHNDKLIILSENDFYVHKSKKKSTEVAETDDIFADQIATLVVNDFVIHKQYGIGKYLGLETMEVSGQKSDFLIIEYKDKDKIYLPVYKFHLIQKYADATHDFKVASLRSKKFLLDKEKAKSSIKKLAFDLLELQARRALKKGFAYSPPDEIYHDFENKFPFTETKDQAKSIKSVLEDMMKETPMDRLVCGDVGFGKTEVAMRASFKAVLDKKQVAVLVPTTILALQHSQSFVKRFKDFPIRVELISRFRSNKELKPVIEDINEGKVDIIIGTHKILSDKIKFYDLGLVIVDEEQRFGVGHKEKLKLLKENVDFLTLTATPIPRTLQLSFLGLKELSLIKTAPPKRQSVKTYLIKDEDSTIATAIKKELQRDGQVFFVHNRVKDIEIVRERILELVPEAKVLVAHGQLGEKDLEKRMREFYLGHYNVLLSTTIIESGIDIPSANTMIINRSHTFGLSQLHQLRGRIGRSERKAYAYFIVPRNQKLSDIQTKRLEAIKKYADIGAGFNLASSDLELRGAGDILGAEQSGHIESIGLELYLELLQEAIGDIKGEKVSSNNLEIQIPDHTYIPSEYISEASERLRYYKKIANLNKSEEIEKIKTELEDVFGIIPEPLNNLLFTIKLRIILSHIALKSISITKKTIKFAFDQKLLEQDDKLRDKIVNFFITKPKTYQFTPKFEVNYKHKSELDHEELERISKNIAQQIDPC